MLLRGSRRVLPFLTVILGFFWHLLMLDFAFGVKSIDLIVVRGRSDLLFGIDISLSKFRCIRIFKGSPFLCVSSDTTLMVGPFSGFPGSHLIDLDVIDLILYSFLVL